MVFDCKFQTALTIDPREEDLAGYASVFIPLTEQVSDRV